MTYSLIGRCARTGRLGLGITTFSLAVGGRCEGVAANVGVCKTQAFPNRTNDPLGIKLLAQGYLPARMSADEVQAAVQAIVAELGASGPGDMGKVMGAVKTRLAGKAEMAAVSAAVKAALAG